MAPPRRKLTATQLAVLARRQAGWTGTDLTVAVAVALAESGGDTWAQAPSGCCHGLWQIHAQAHGETVDALRDPAHNARVAKRIYDQAGGWGPWQAHSNGAYRPHMLAASAAVAATAGGSGGGGILDTITGALGDAASVITDPAGAVTDTVTDAASDALTAAVAVAGLDDLPRKVLTIGVGMVLLTLGSSLIGLGIWRLATVGPRQAIDASMTATGAAATLGALA